MSRVYLDHNATSPLRPEATEAFVAAMHLPGNASSIHAEGRIARELIEDAREKVAASAGCSARQIVFTSGGSEANVAALSPGWFADGAEPRLFISAIEHPSVLQGGQFAPDRITKLSVDADGVVDLDATRQDFENWREKTGGAPFLVSVMLANNETGVLQPVTELAELAHQFGGLVHSDLVQAFGKIPLDLSALGVDLAAISAHKIGGPKGAGALAVLRDGLPVAALIRGGGQEFGYRAGTENVAAIAGFGAVADGALTDWAHIEGLRDQLETRTRAITPALCIFADSAARLPNTSCFAAPGMDAERLLISLDLGGIAVSAGSACSSGKVARSHVLAAMGVAPEMASGAIRVSLGWNSTLGDVDRFIGVWESVMDKFTERRQVA
jgi:cysteine desulfurase